MAKSLFHRNLICNKSSDLYNSIKVVPNGISSKFELKKLQINSDFLLSTSSPDRCLSSLIEISDNLFIYCERTNSGEIDVAWAYGFNAGVSEGGLEADTRPEVASWVTSIKKDLSNSGIIDLGRLSQDEIVSRYKKSGYFVYATMFPEIDCISLTKAMASGSIPIIACPENSVFVEKINKVIQAVPELKELGLITISNEPVDEGIDTSIKDSNVIEELCDNFHKIRKYFHKIGEFEHFNIRIKMAKCVYDEYNWTSIAKEWTNLFTNNLEPYTN